MLGVLWLLGFVSVLMLIVSSIFKNNVSSAKDAVNLLQAEGAADAGVHMAIEGIISNTSDNYSFVDTAGVSTSIYGSQINILLRAESGKIDINNAPLELIRRLLVKSKASSSEVSRIIDIVRELREKYAVLSSANQQASDNRERYPFYSLVDFKNAVQLSDELYTRICPSITVYSGKGAIRTAWALPDVLSALQGISERDINEIIDARKSKKSLLNNPGYLFSQKELEGEAVSIRVSAKTEDVMVVHNAIIRFMNSKVPPYIVVTYGRSDCDVYASTPR